MRSEKIALVGTRGRRITLVGRSHEAGNRSSTTTSQPSLLTLSSWAHQCVLERVVRWFFHDPRRTKMR